ncbi:phage major capsid protein [Mycobacterium parmense]|uniref:Phage capsid-like C-terminal domain-containing protein n=1 Tax=Mycobacterium parmense TaxID=185642 RepID=A0A7I7YS82_9MYCO|nr:phage major capsid protein [Mycobacterium parmense]MCV7351794.1 phage major capsid protein [Mycobacterium parmense]ORW63014.1 hypothetical protein AWC20_04580 [Mycobacterium parmense]BBZ44736.1 hypothetical protein MPRM_20170 [Mycobacterium parmense]
MSNRLQAQYDRLAALRTDLRGKRDAVVARAEREGRKDLTEAETRSFTDLTDRLKDVGARCGDAAEELRRAIGDGDDLTARVRQATAGVTAGASAVMGGRIAPITFDETELQRAWSALSAHQSYRIESRAYGTIDSLLPPELYPNIVGPVYENRLLSRLPVTPCDAPFVRYIRHYGTTGAAAIVGEGQPKPELVPQTDEVTIEMAKLAAHVGTSWESVRDWPSWQEYLTQDLAREIYSAENAQLLTGSGTGSNITGFTSVSGILTHQAGTGTTPLSPLDDIELSIATMRTGAVLAEPDIFVVHPTTWSAIRRSKDRYGRYQVAPDPTANEAKSVWGVPALVTTQFPAGEGLLIDSSRLAACIGGKA